MWKALELYYPEQAEEIIGLSEDFMNEGHYVSKEYICAWVWYHELQHTDIAED
mgnify:CR=1 FL=1